MKGFKIFLTKAFLFFSFLGLSAGLFTNMSFAQDAGGKEDDLVKSSMNDLALVGGMGIAGAVLGLSTLSFAEHPSEHLNNILIGGSIGIIVGVAVVAFNQASKSSEAVLPSSESAMQEPAKDFSSWERLAYHHEAKRSQNLLFPPQVSYSFSF